MLFNSLEFLLFLPAVFLFYWFLLRRSLGLQNLFLLAVSYVFYGWWDYRFLSLLFASTLLDYFLSLQIHRSKSDNKRRSWLFLSILGNLGVLGFFKYYNFFAQSLADAFSTVGVSIDPLTLNIVLPVGISFYTFQTMSYTIDIYRKQITPTRNLVAFAAFVAFFPQLVAGPIERASNLLPQMLKERTFDLKRALEGVRLMLWGFFKKILIADALAPTVNEIFGNYDHYSGGTLLIGASLFAFQIYGDFSGYSDIARGISKLFGFELMVNFNFPYFSRNIAEFWRRWHISLSTWFRDYIYIPLGGSKVGKGRAIGNVFIIFLVSGFWHGANWTFIAWGAVHATLFIPSFIVGNNRKYIGAIQPTTNIINVCKTAIQIVTTFFIVALGWVFFRSPSIQVACDILSSIFTDMSSFETLINPYDNQSLFLELIVLTLFIFVEFVIYVRGMSYNHNRSELNVVTDVALLSLVIMFTQISSDLAFIYFQF